MCGGRAVTVLCCLRGAVLACLARERPGASSCPGTSLFWTAGLSTGCQKTTEECEICFLGKELTPGARNSALLPSLLWPGPITSVWTRCCPAVPVPVASSPSCFIWAAGQNCLKFFTGLFELAVGSPPCIWLQWVWRGYQQSVENYRKLLGGDGTPLLNIMCGWSPAELPASLLSVCGAEDRLGMNPPWPSLAEVGAAPRRIWCTVSSSLSVTNKTTNVLKTALLGFASGRPGEWQPGTDYGSLEASSLGWPTSCLQDTKSSLQDTRWWLIKDGQENYRTTVMLACWVSHKDTIRRMLMLLGKGILPEGF